MKGGAADGQVRIRVGNVTGCAHRAAQSPTAHPLWSIPKADPATHDRFILVPATLRHWTGEGSDKGRVWGGAQAHPGPSPSFD